MAWVPNLLLTAPSVYQQPYLLLPSNQCYILLLVISLYLAKETYSAQVVIIAYSLMGFLLCPLVAVSPLGEPGPLTLQNPEGTGSTDSKSGSLGLMVSWAIPVVTSDFPDSCALPIRRTAYTMVMD